MVGDELYYWRAIGSDLIIKCIVTTEEAFDSGKSPQQLQFSLGYDEFEYPSNSGESGYRQQTAISPGVIRLAIEQGKSQNPPFTGKVGEVDVVLKGAAVDELQKKARLDRSGRSE